MTLRRPRPTAQLAAVVLLAASAVHSAISWAQDTYPAKPITVIVPYPAGGGVDNLVRLLQQRLEARLGQPLIIDNKSGAGGTIGTALLARAQPDGYTLGVVFDSHATAPAIYRTLPYSIFDDFVSIAGLVRMPMVLAVPIASPHDSIEQFVAAAKAQAGKLSYASSGAGSSNHLAAKLLEDKAGIQMTHVPYRGGAPAMTDLAGGHVDAMFQNPLTTMPFVTSKRLKVIGMTAPPAPSSTAYAAPISDTLPGYEVYSWMAVIAPKGTPEAVVQRVNAAINDVLSEPAIAARLSEVGLEPTGGTTKALDTLIREAATQWGEIIVRENITAG